MGIKTVDETVKHVGFDGTDKSILYTPQSVNKGETIQTKLVFTGNYITEATSITFLPATNVLYEENFMTNRGTHGEWIPEGENNTATVVKDNENSVYGYADAYNGFAYYSNGGALKATLNLNGGKRAYTTDAVEFSFSGTGLTLFPNAAPIRDFFSLHCPREASRSRFISLTPISAAITVLAAIPLSRAPASLIIRFPLFAQ